LLSEVRESIDRHETFALESTLSGKTYVRIFRRALSSGYELELHYLWLSNLEQAIARVRRRVRMGGHDVPVTDIRRRFKRSLAHLINDYLTLATRWAIWDNRGLPAKRLATSATDDLKFCPTLDRTNEKESKREWREKTAGICFSENRKRGLSPVVWKNGKVRQVPA